MINKNTSTKFDSIEIEIIWNRLITILEEQAKTLIRTSFSNILSDSGDLSAGLFDSKGNMIAQANTGTPGHINSMAKGVSHFLEHYSSNSLHPGDVLIGNNAYEISGHLLDVTIVTPVFYNKNHIGYFASTCHVIDIGGVGYSPEGESIYEEGLHIPYLKYYIKGELNHSVQTIIEANTREPYKVLGDLRAQVVSQEVAILHLIEMMDEFNLNEIDTLGKEIMNISENAMRKAISKLPDGTYENEIFVDGIEEPVKLKCTINIKKDQLFIDFAGSSTASKKGINVSLYYTSAYVTFVLKAIIAPDIPNNQGSFIPVNITAPEGSIVNASHPMPTAARHVIGHAAPACVLGAMYYAIPKRTMAEGANVVWSVQLYGQDMDNNPFSYVTFLCGGMGARPNKDGLSATGFPSGVGGTPVEIVESTSPIVFYQKELRQDSGGSGEYRGGLGQIVRFGVRTNKPYYLPAMFDRLNYPAKGLEDGNPGAKAEVLLNNNKKMTSKRLYTLNPKDIITLKLPGGGGYGDPKKRNPKLILHDVINEYISPESANKYYGISVQKAQDGWKLN